MKVPSQLLLKSKGKIKLSVFELPVLRRDEWGLILG